MIIEWNQNPFLSKIIIDDKDKELMLLKYQNDTYIDLFCEMEVEIDRSIDSQLSEQLKVLSKKWQKICNFDIDSPEIQFLFHSLDDEHCGDCICVPMTCTRCYAESLLGISTLPGGQHEMRLIEGAFKPPETTITEAIQKLKKIPDYTAVPSNWDAEQYAKNIPRWEAHRLSAIITLEQYKKDHNF